MNKPKNPMQLAFENYLNLVAQLYYKATHQITDPNATQQANDLFKSSEDKKPLIPVDKPKRPGRKAKPKPLPQPSQEDPMTDELKEKGDSADGQLEASKGGE